MRAGVVAGVSVCLLSVGCATPHDDVGAASQPPVTTTAAPDVEQRLELARGLTVLHAWDTRRAAAYASGDRTALRRLYPVGSPLARADLRLLERYDDRGLVVRGLAQQVVRAAVVTRTSTRWVLRVRERTVGGVAVHATAPQRRVTLPETASATHVVTLRRGGGRWVLTRVQLPTG